MWGNDNLSKISGKEGALTTSWEWTWNGPTSNTVFFALVLIWIGTTQLPSYALFQWWFMKNIRGSCVLFFCWYGMVYANC